MKTGQMGFDIEAESPEVKPTVFTVSQLNRIIRGQLEGQFQQIWVRGEISNFKAHTSGHHYFSLKDDGSQLNAVMFKGFNSKLKFRPENGLEVIIKGKITVYEPRGTYQIFCEWMEPVGAGALQKAFEQLKAKLDQEGLFDPERKRKLPMFPRHIGVVTSPTGAAIKDILNVLRRRFRGARVTISPTLVQGPGAAEQIVKALELLNQVDDVDVVIVGRGGGSIEDLWPFNEEIVARAIANSRIPTISAVGHEVDFTIADFVADLRAPTPSAAAEIVVKNASELAERIMKDSQRLSQGMRTKILHSVNSWRHLSKRLVDPRRRLQDLIIRCDELSGRLGAAIERYLCDCRTGVEMATHRLGNPETMISALRQKMQYLTRELSNKVAMNFKSTMSRLREDMARLETLSPLKVVERGYSIVKSESSQKIVKDASEIAVGEILDMRFAKGSAKAKVVEIKN